MNQTKEAKKDINIEVKWAIVFITIQLLWFLGEKIAGLHDGNVDRQVQLTPVLVIIGLIIFYLALREKKEKVFNGNCNFKQAYFSGFNLTVLITVISPLVYYIAYSIISPDYFDKVIAFQVEAGKMTQEEALDSYNLGTYLIQSIVGTFLLGMLISTGLASVIRTKPVEKN